VADCALIERRGRRVERFCCAKRSFQKSKGDQGVVGCAQVGEMGGCG
jgi:hypothetical protein